MSIAEEIQKCKESPVYFYNTYTVQGKQRPITQEEYDDIIKRASGIIFLRARRHNYVGSLIRAIKELPE